MDLVAYHFISSFFTFYFQLTQPNDDVLCMIIDIHNNLPLVAQNYLTISFRFFLTFYSVQCVFGFVLVDRYCMCRRSYRLKTIWIVQFFGRSEIKPIIQSQTAANYINGARIDIFRLSEESLAIVINEDAAIFLLVAPASSSPETRKLRKCFGRTNYS